MKTVLTIAGSDPSGGAGIQADLKTCLNFGVYGLSVITALTAQTPDKVEAILPIEERFVKRQLLTLIENTEIDVVKIGMIATIKNIVTISKILKQYPKIKIVLDPVFISSSGRRLLEINAIETFKKELIPIVTVITPNILEAGILSKTKIYNIKDMYYPAKSIFDLGAKYVLIKGGDLKNYAIDLLYDGEKFTEYISKKIKRSFHGSGCIYSSALSALLAKGWNIEKACLEAKLYVTNVIKNGIRLNKYSSFVSVGSGLYI